MYWEISEEAHEISTQELIIIYQEWQELFILALYEKSVEEKDCSGVNILVCSQWIYNKNIVNNSLYISLINTNIKNQKEYYENWLEEICSQPEDTFQNGNYERYQ